MSDTEANFRQWVRVGDLVSDSSTMSIQISEIVNTTEDHVIVEWSDWSTTTTQRLTYLQLFERFSPMCESGWGTWSELEESRKAVVNEFQLSDTDKRLARVEAQLQSLQAGIDGIYQILEDHHITSKS